jgi:predicted nucleic acid-binding protein
VTYLLDTNVVSELRKPHGKADENVRAWAAARPAAELYLSVVTILEIERGIAQVGRRDELQAQRLQRWLEDELLDVFRARILPLDVPAARRTARLHVPDPRPERDALIAGTALAHNMTIATRNIRDFESMGVPVINPWER